MKKSIMIVLLFLISSQVNARMLFVPQIYPTIQTGIDSSLAGDTVMVQLGTYHERINLNGHNITVASTFLTTQDSSRIIATIIDGDQGGPVITIEHGEDSTCSIVGFSVLNGNSPQGGGIRCSGTSPVIRNNIISYCRGNIEQGGGIYSEGGRPLIDHNHLNANRAQNGGGIYCINSSAIITNNNIHSDSASGYGGGIYCHDSDVLISGNSIWWNIGGNGAGIDCSFGQVRIYGNLITHNTAYQNGGGINTGGAGPQIYGNRIEYNYAKNGGGINCTATPVISNNIIRANSATGNGNYDGFGGGIRIDGEPLIYNNLVLENAAYRGGGISTDGNKIRIWNSIIWDNTASHQGAQIYKVDGPPPVVVHCDVKGGWPGTGNLNSDPLFRLYHGEEYHLQSVECGYASNSPCVDAGIADIRDSLLSCDWGKGTDISDIGVYGGGTLLSHQSHMIAVPGDFSLVQQAVNSSFDGDTIIVHPGVYHENLDFYWHAPILGSLFLTTGDTSYISSTIIDGNNTNAVITIVRADSGATVIGLTIQNGLGTNGGGIFSQYSIARFEKNIICQNIANYSAGGIGCSNGSYYIFHNIIRDNIATHSGGAIFCQSQADIIGNTCTNNTAGYYGGAIFCNYSDILISSNYFENNSGRLGGAICCQVNPTISENVIIQNHATQRGGGIFCWSDAGPLIEWNQIVGNNADLDGGGLYLTEGADATVSNNYIDSNNCFYGAGIYCSSDAEITDNTISSNNGPFGAGIYCVASSPLIADNQFSWNIASMRGAGIYCYDNAAPLIMHNRIYENEGQGIYCYESSPMVVNNIIVQNIAEFGAGLYTWNSHPFVTNTIFWNNQADQGPDIVADGDNAPQITYCDIQQGWAGDGNFSLSPLFRDMLNHDYRLSATACGQLEDSPCIDSGWPELPDSLLDCDHGLGLIRSDMGAFGGDRLMVDVEDDDINLPEQMLLEQNYPNPFNNRTIISYNLSLPSDVSIDIYDIMGRQVTSLVNKYESAGLHQIIWDATGISSGVYFYTIKISNNTEIKKMTLIK